VLVQAGYPGGADCRPDILQCDQPVAPPGDCASVCPHAGSTCSTGSFDGGNVACFYGCGGRRPDALLATSRGPDALSSAGAFFAELAVLEAASVDAFEILAGELAFHGAPPAVVDRAREAARDEVRHAKITRALARRFGEEPAPHTVVRHPPRTLEAMAIENAAEGCVRETYGALVAMHQAERATDPIVRRAMRRVAEDETRHAALARSIAEWILPLLDAGARARTNAARAAALDELARQAAVEPSADARDTAGLPSAAVATHLVRSLRDLDA
jgi:hypothetical protein